jgi:bacterioferritin-associated ferredoxin
MNTNDIFICRCEDVSLEDLQRAFSEGITDFQELKRLLRIGMGPCRGLTCGELLQRELAKHLQKEMQDIKTSTVRPPVMGVKLAAIRKGAEHEG